MQKKTRVCTSLVDGVPKCPGTNIQKRVCNSQKCPGNLHNGFLFVFSVLEAPRASINLMFCCAAGHYTPGLYKGILASYNGKNRLFNFSRALNAICPLRDWLILT